ncbi:NAD(P)H-hydrate dehydratase [Altererythrobacter aurantiacus]|uniref:ADP-dependent (S)-NAD(P)H-hydrate dehydratase n=1 Tax=Parapontixanthobacter aurantiacus TaxID=1463599 RepID=A0A844ZAU2_9SPHN|nr:NAD(P)H-hydrate dehydratase [Parapontixanthobacter aurantiacus]MXO84422.1 NAD(P)H-hydrate dehydratase [Parapontixanthobacter aurantiacus]
MTDNADRNDPDVWGKRLPRPSSDGHKYDRGFVAIFGAVELTGATRLAAGAASRIGAGLVGVVARERGDVYRASLLPDIMVSDVLPQKANVLLGGPGGIADNEKATMLKASEMDARVFDAGAIPQERQFGGLDPSCIFTPHIGEFERNFGALEDGPVAGAIRVAQQSNAVIVLKSSRTVIAHPDGRSIVNEHASPYLAKAGTGDVLAGMIAGLAAQGMPSFEASCAAVWMHGEAGRRIGPGLIAGDIVEGLPKILKDLL